MAKKHEGLRVIFLGGLCEIGKNMTALEYGDDIIVVDCGLTFPSIDMPGVDLVIPDITYLVENRDRVRGIVLTHGHEDHIGAMPYVLKDLNVPVFGTKITLALVEGKLREHKLENFVLNTVAPKQVVPFGKSFRVEFIRVNHSIAGSCALAINTPVGVVFHTGDFKIDFTPVDGAIADLPRIAEIGKHGVQLLLSESTNVERTGHSMSEAGVYRGLNTIFNDNEGRRIIIATFSSNIHRIQQIIDLAVKYKRKVAFSGRSMLNVAEIAAKIGELRYDKDIVVDIDRIKNVADKELIILATGSQGEPSAALTRMSTDEFNKVTIGANDTIIISATPIPGNERMVSNVVNNLYRKGARVVYESLAEVHASGHAYQDELRMMYSLLRPKFFVPIHGEYRHLKKHAEMAMSMGHPPQNIFLGDVGNVVEVTKSTIKQVNNVPSGYLLVDGLGVGDVGSTVLRDRKHLSEDGMFMVVLGIDRRNGELTALDVTSRGFVYIRENDDLFEGAKQVIKDLYEALDQKELADWGNLKNTIRKDVANYLFKKTQRRPMILTMILES
ncbi:MAG: ribonuclease J [Firmicutes bacterium]|nr:ribonuclease J [Bacillota bacterium]